MERERGTLDLHLRCISGTVKYLNINPLYTLLLVVLCCVLMPLVQNRNCVVENQHEAAVHDCELITLWALSCAQRN